MKGIFITEKLILLRYYLEMRKGCFKPLVFGLICYAAINDSLITHELNGVEVGLNIQHKFESKL